MAEPAIHHRRAVAERNVEAILDAAEGLLARYEPMSMSSVAAEAGVSRQTLYAHFPDRERLFSAVLKRAVQRWVKATEAVEPHRGPPLEALGRLIDIGWHEISRNAHIARVASAELDPEAVRVAHDSGVELLRRLIRRGRRDGSFRRDVPVEWLVSAFFGLIHSARDEVAAGRLSSRAALQALSRTVPDLFRGFAGGDAHASPRHRRDEQPTPP
jgi:TetR/AcrR family transcriptional regulator, mexCD-oprJ operon repressor